MATSTTPISPTRSQDSSTTPLRETGDSADFQELVKKVAALGEEVVSLRRSLERKDFQLQELHRELERERSERLAFERVRDRNHSSLYH